MTPKQLGTLIRNAREKQGLSREALAASVEISLRTLTSIEEGAEGTHLITVLRLLRKLGVRP